MISKEWKYSPTLIEERGRVSSSSDLRERIRFDLEGRPPYAWGILTAADLACFFGFSRIKVIEFGVAGGDGLLEMCRLAALINDVTRIEIDVVGFDNGIGLPPPQDFRDHPELWSVGDFSMGDVETLQSRLPSNCELIIGDIKNTIGGFLNSLTFDAPIGFCSFDTDIYSSTVSALAVYTGKPELCLPAGVAYFDDTIGGPHSFGGVCRNKKAGQLLAIDEFNTTFPLRVIDLIRTLKHRRPLAQEQWLDQVYSVHMLDHPSRNRQRRSEALSMSAHASAPWIQWPF
jgi:hypothetical protein